MYIPQRTHFFLSEAVTPNKVVILYGPRRVGKSTLIQKYLESQSAYLMAQGDDIFTQEILSSQSLERLKSFVGQHTLLVIDEGQQIPNIGLNLKLLVDHVPGLKVIVTGSSSFDLQNKLGEPPRTRPL